MTGEQEHKILIRTEGTFLSGEGYVIDSSRLNIKGKRKVSYEIRRH